MTDIAGRFDHIVLGAGGIGSATAYWLAQSGSTSVLCLEQFDLLHELGASMDYSRIIRHAYNSTDYTALTGASYETWGEIEEATGLTLVTRTGGLDIGPEHRVGPYANALEATGHPCERMDSGELTKRWPQWTVRDTDVAVFQKDSGILDIRAASYAHVALAKSAGVSFVDRTPVTRIVEFPDRVEVVTDKGVFVGRTLSVCGGSWSPMLFEGLGVRNPIAVSHEQVCYWATQNLKAFSTREFGIWIYHDEGETYYGFPVFGLPGTKAGRDEPHDLIDPTTRSWDVREDNLEQVESFMRAHLPEALGPRIFARACCYDLTPDRNFLVDKVAGSQRVSLFCGAGHAAKFASLMGKIMAELAVEGGSKYPIDPFRWDRPAITDPDFASTLVVAGQDMA
ncbi:N-methyltryptophan oxidase [Rhodococcoides trifolii]|uniref:N-methyltryptophan oxidase n=1 Tax=Rhodococcoides trifolii TaxID=908250 RepID=A0A917G5F2_9NOCA|nr:FAD-dependent oxidoreductase [Rhodococcus trifolii]GGG23791.1 N-methyltryptophan oxidase [Rhodococcus trifolii]